MTMDALLDRIEAETDIDDDDRAREALETTLATFGRRISREEGKDIATHLPDEIETAVIDWDEAEPVAFSVDEFLERVAADLDVTEQRAQHIVQAVMDALEAEVTTTQLEAARTQLPEEYQTLF